MFLGLIFKIPLAVSRWPLQPWSCCGPATLAFSWFPYTPAPLRLGDFACTVPPNSCPCFHQTTSCDRHSSSSTNNVCSGKLLPSPSLPESVSLSHRESSMSIPVLRGTLHNITAFDCLCPVVFVTSLRAGDCSGLSLHVQHVPSHLLQNCTHVALNGVIQNA